MTFASSAFKRIEDPSESIVTVDQLKVFARIDIDAEDTMLQSFIDATTETGEIWSRRAFASQKWQYRLTNWPSNLVVKLPRPPLVSVDLVRLLREDGTVEAVLCSSSYYIVTDTEPGRLVLREGSSHLVWPADAGPYLIEIQYTCGYGTAADVPEGIKQGILFWAAAAYESRAPQAAPPDMSASILRRYRVPIL